MDPKKVILKDGYTGEHVICFADPLETDGDLVKLQVAEVGKTHLIRWVYVSELKALAQ